MKNYILYSCFIAFTFLACEDVIDVDVDSITPRLVVEGGIEWEKNTTGNVQRIRLSQSTDFFDESSPAVTDAQVVMNQLNSTNSYAFLHVDNGWYEITDFEPVIGATYELLIDYDNQSFRAVETMISVPEVARIEQTTALAFDGGDEVSIDFYANDPAGQANFYLANYLVNDDPTPFIFVADDDFLDGNELPFFYRQSFVDDEEELLPNDVVNIEFLGISEDFYNYMFVFTEQVFGGFGPFSTTPVEIRGNVVNQTRPDENAFGFFYLSERVTFDVIVE
ncbi:MAG: DUF4249 domain-containing protein [Saprospiraceae bacterium]|nr:DUF4249 domain-containing protein [Saprospiraceae bacterium]